MFHGVFRRFPFALNAKSKQEIPFDAALAAHFSTILGRLQQGEKILSFSEIMWPFQTIQSEPNMHVLVDDVGIFNLDQKLVNAPRIAQVGHVLRDPTQNHLQQLDLVKKVLLFQHTIQMENNAETGANGSDAEFIPREIKGIVNRGFLEGIYKLINLVKEFPIADFSTLESVLNFENALNSAQKFVNSIEECKGNRLRWETARKLVETPVEKWRLELTVAKKDIEERYKSLIAKAKELDESKIVTKLDIAKDSADVWLVREQKNIIERIGKLFVAPELIFQDTSQKNAFFLNTDKLKTYDINEVIERAEKQVDVIRNALVECTQKISEIEERLMKIREDVQNSNLSAEERVQRINNELMDKKIEQENKIRQLLNERDNELANVQGQLDSLEHTLREIYEQIDKKIQDCQQDVLRFGTWQLDDKIANIPASTARYFLPIGVALIQDEDEEERIEVVLPCEYDEKLARTMLSDGFRRIEKEITKILEKNMKIRSNFEFTLEKMNVKNTPNYRKSLMLGYDLLINGGLATVEQKEQGLKILEQIK